MRGGRCSMMRDAVACAARAAAPIRALRDVVRVRVASRSRDADGDRLRVAAAERRPASRYEATISLAASRSSSRASSTFASHVTTAGHSASCAIVHPLLSGVKTAVRVSSLAMSASYAWPPRARARRNKQVSDSKSDTVRSPGSICDREGDEPPRPKSRPRCALARGLAGTRPSGSTSRPGLRAPSVGLPHRGERRGSDARGGVPPKHPRRA